LTPMDVVDDVIDDVTDKIGKAITRNGDDGNRSIELDVGTARGILALDVIDKVSKVYMVERAARWWKPIEATFAPYKDKVELVKGVLSSKKKRKGKEEESEKKKREKKIRLVDLLEKCGEQRVFVMLDIEGKELDVLKDAQEYLQAAKNPITLAVCAYHRTTDYDDLMRFFEAIGYHTETQPGYVYTDMIDGRGLHSLRRGIIRASNV